MRYQDALRAGNISYFQKRGTGALRAARLTYELQRVHMAISDLRSVAFLSEYSPGEDRPVALAVIRRVKRRVLKRWSVRLIREALPRSARLTGPRL